MKLDHTPGPWEIYDRGEKRRGLRYWLRGVDSEIGGVRIADVVTAANARLIAAAPEMLETLIKLYRGLYGNYEPVMQSEYDAQQELKKLIVPRDG